MTPYDVNFCFPVRELENERVLLTPFVPAIHAEPYHRASSAYPYIYEHLSFGPFATQDELVKKFIEKRFSHEPSTVLFAVLDKLTPVDASIVPIQVGSVTYGFAGLIGLLNASPQNLSAEIGFVFVLPPFQRTHVSSNMIGLLLQYCFGPLGLIRVQWQTSTKNQASSRAAERMGFKLEATKRWDRSVPADKSSTSNGIDIPKNRIHTAGDLARNSLLLGMGPDDWSGGVRDKIQEIMQRKV